MTPREALGTLWYHDHTEDFTAPNVYRRMAGFHLAYDHIDRKRLFSFSSANADLSDSMAVSVNAPPNKMPLTSMSRIYQPIGSSLPASISMIRDLFRFRNSETSNYW